MEMLYCESEGENAREVYFQVYNLGRNELLWLHVSIPLKFIRMNAGYMTKWAILETFACEICRYFG